MNAITGEVSICMTICMTVMFLFCYSCVSLLQAVYFADYGMPFVILHNYAYFF